LQQQSRRLAWTSAVIHGLVHASMLLLPTLLGDLQRAFHVSLLRLLAVANAMYFVYAVAAVWAGFLADRFGSGRMLVIAAAGCALSLLAVAAAPSFWVLALGLISLGLCAGVYHPSGLSLLSRGVASGERGRAMGIHGAGGNLGEAIAPTWARAFATAINWRAGFVVAAVLSFACALLASTLPSDVARRAPHQHPPAAPPRQRTFAETLSSFGRILGEFVRDRRLRWLLLSMIATAFVYRGFLTFISLHLADGLGGGAGASYVMSAALLAGMFGQRLGGELADRRSPEPLYLLLAALVVPVLLLLAVTSGQAAVAAAIGFGFVWALAQPVANALIAHYGPSGDHGVLYGIQFAATFGVGSFATTFGAFLLGSGGTRAVFLGLAGLAALSLLAVAALVRAASSGART
jgi:MFS family permease